MEKDNLEQFIQANREAFDQAKPNRSVWDTIERGLSNNDPHHLDSLESFVISNKASFDMVQPNEKVWNKIEQAIDEDANLASDSLESFVKENRAALNAAKVHPHAWSFIDKALDESPSCEIENFVQNNRTSFDSQKAHPRVWNEIEKSIIGEAKIIKRAKLFKFIRLAAAACFLLIAGGFFGLTLFGNDENPNDKLNAQIPQYEEMNEYYQNKIDNQLLQLANYNINDEEVNHDLKQLDEVFEELKTELINSEHENNEALINAMLKNYQTKISILEQVLQKVHTGESDKKLKDETIKI
ncbi:MAG: hypothetical protein AAGK97_02695 [Bacteroidota bacterium]